jgi:2-polyprenyl-3-methyl-5-hydroxy-6-metoxy-1,4-benzoquinol methylase
MKMDKNVFPYREFSNYLSVDLEKLRPRGSYKFLIENRNHNIESFIADGAISKEFLNPRKCPSCQVDRYMTVMNKDGFNIVKCLNCALVYVSEILDERFYDDTYSSEKYASVVAKLGFESHVYRKERFGAERVSKLAEFWNAIEFPSFLDVGCSTGFVVHAAAEIGWAAKGIDLNTHAIEFGKVNYGLSLSSENFFEIDGCFDFIGMYDVLEHVTNPSTFLENAYQHLKQNGCIHIYVPNWNSASRYVLGAHSHFIWPSHHLTYFTPGTLTKMMQSTGFEVLEMETEGLDFFDIHWMKSEGVLDDEFEVSERILDVLQFLANAGGHGKNLRCIARKIG